MASETSTPVLLTKTGTILTAAIVDMDTVFPLLVPAPGPGLFLEYISIHWQYVFNNTAYTTNLATEILVRYAVVGASSLGSGLAGTFFADQPADADFLITNSLDGATIRIPALSLDFSDAGLEAVLGTPWTGGDGDLKFAITYRVHALEIS